MIFLLVLLLGPVFGVYLDYYGDGEYEYSNIQEYNSKKGDPVLISSFTVDMGQPLELPCKLKKSVNIQ